ncbi:hypothetical protein F4801DRAFT_588290 [Xylaria longipes]|nr:hypothetical protein F4801DRAFT_588290 [Xylaria longipes]
MSVLKPFEVPYWLFRLLDYTYYVGSKTFTDQVWVKIFNNLSMYPEFDLGPIGIGDNDVKTYIRGRLACLLPDSNCHYGHDQISVWMSLMTSSLTVSNDNLQRVLAMDNSRHSSLSGHGANIGPVDGLVGPGSRGFFVCSWTISVSELDILHNYLKNKEITFHELVAWDTFIADKELGPEDRIIIRYIGSCLLSEWPIKQIENIYEQTEDDRSGILAEFLPAVASALPTVAESCQYHLIRHITTSAEDKEGYHELVHSILIEFFGASFVLNRHPDSKASKCLTQRTGILASLNLHLDHRVLGWRFFGYSPTVMSNLQIHFNKMMDFVARNREATGTNNDVLQLDRMKRDALFEQSLPEFYKRNKTIMVIVARGININEYICGRPFARGWEPANHLLGRILSGVKGMDLRAMHPAYFAYYCLAPWPKPGCLVDAIVTFGKGMAACVARQCVHGGLYATDAYLADIGQPVIRQIGKHHFIHVPLLDPNQCRYGVDYVDEAACKFMQTSFWNAMFVADLVMRVLDGPEAMESEIVIQTDSEKDFSDGNSSSSEEVKNSSANAVVRGPTQAPTQANESEVICRLAMQSYREFFATNAGKAFSKELDKDFRVLDDVVEKEPLLIT